MVERNLAEIDLRDYEISGLENVMTPALAIYLDAADNNIRTTLNLLGGDAERWRPHVKTTKLAAVMERLTASGVRNYKCATTLELATVCSAGAGDVLVAYPCYGPRVARVREIASEFPAARVSSIVEDRAQVPAWKGGAVGLFIDINPGMNRTGIEQSRLGDIVALARDIRDAGLMFRGLHYYDGQIRDQDPDARTNKAHRGYDRLMEIAAALEKAGLAVEEVVTAGTPAFPCSLSYAPFRSAGFLHRMSPGTVVYGDTSSLAQLPAEWRYRPAAVVLSTIVSSPAPGWITCDAGHKTVSADAGIPNCAVLGHPDLHPEHPSEEHLPIRTTPGGRPLQPGEILYLVPRHVCPTVNNFSQALLVREGKIASLAEVTARGREAPIRVRNL